LIAGAPVRPPKKSSLDLNTQSATINRIVMAHLSPQKRKKRRVQLREAQRRRRARLKDEAKSFLQIILDQETLHSLRAYSDSQGKPLHICAADLIRGGLVLAPEPTRITGSPEEACCGEVENPAPIQKESSEESDVFREHADRTPVGETEITVEPRSLISPVALDTDEQMLETDLKLKPKNQMELFIE
jgi:hypothetical protein